MLDEYRARLTLIRRRRRIMIISTLVLVGLAIFGTGLDPLLAKIGIPAQQRNPILAGFPLLVCLLLFSLLLNLECPRCKGPFFRARSGWIGTFRPFASSCSNCNLPLSERKSDDGNGAA